MLNARSAWLAGAASVAVIVAGCSDEPRSRAIESCSAPAGTAPFIFTSAARQLFGFVDAPEGEGPHPVAMLLHDGGRTDITRDNGGFTELRAAFREAGIATVVWDAAGSGCSGGRYRGIADLYVRADDVLAAAAALAERDDIDASRVGAWAVGEGAWVAPMAAARSNALAFLILVGGSGGDPIERLSVFATQNLVREGYPQDEAEAVARRLADALEMMRDQAPYRDYRAAMEPLTNYPLLPSMSESGADIHPTERRYDELRESAVLHVEPRVFLAALEIPVLALWGEHDGWTDRERAASVYREAFALAANEAASVKVVDDADHTMCAASGPTARPFAADSPETSCALADGYLETMTAWLERNGFTGRGERQTRAPRR